MIEITPLNKKQLLDYINSKNFGKGNHIPITIHRALSQVKNPQLQEEDIILILALDEGDLIGYTGIIPYTIFLKGKDPIRIGWLSCLWVSKLARGKGISVKLLSKSVELWNSKAIAADYVPATKVIYDKTNQFVNKPLEKKGIRLYVKCDLYNILPSKKAIFFKIKWLFKAIDSCVNVFVDFRLVFYKKGLPHLHFEFVDHIDEEVNIFIKNKQENQLFRRNMDELNWMIQNPWLISSNKKDNLNKKYYFSSTAKSFNFYSLKVKNSDGILIAFMIFSKRDTTLKLPYFYHNNCIDSVVDAINYYMIKWEIRTFTTYNSDIAQILATKKTPAIFKKVVIRNYMISSVFKDEVFNSNFEIQDGDGDCGFT